MRKATNIEMRLAEVAARAMVRPLDAMGKYYRQPFDVWVKPLQDDWLRVVRALTRAQQSKRKGK